MKRVFLTLLSLLLFIAILFVYSFHHKETKSNLTFSELPFMDEVRIKHMKEGSLKWSISAKKAIFLNTNEIELSDLEIFFPEKDLTLKSQSGFYNHSNQSFLITGKIKAQTNNFIINAENLSWDATKNQLSSNKKIEIVGNNFFIEGNELSASLDKARLNSNVKAIFK
ncbi:MAG: LPS export ABC transporter periplasmic protein LptC [Thermodesulfovibrionales bacterium]|nr:LPS export ABC transporter periplasmic protein LptC [Thermodesulfovibrionales bacterium]